MNLIIIFFIIVVLVFLLMVILWRYVLVNSVIDVFNDCSFYFMFILWGGGVFIVISFLLVILFLGFLGVVDWIFVIVLFGVGFGIVIIGFFDDYGYIVVCWRFFGYFVVVFWIFYWLGGFFLLFFLGIIFDMGWFGYILVVIYLVWMFNFYNFMDGIDGIVGIEVIIVCFGGVLFFFCLGKGLDNEGVWVFVVFVSVVLGFLIWNFFLVKIFMGDVGSGFLGVVLGVFFVKVVWVVLEFFWSWLIFLGIFVVDVIFILL